jgi:hypothetical protein
VVSFTTPAALPPGKEPMDRRLGGPPSRSGRDGEETNSQLLPGLEPPIIQPVAQRYTVPFCCVQFARTSFLTYIAQCSDQTGSGAHPASCRMGTGPLTPGVKRQGRVLTARLLVPRLSCVKLYFNSPNKFSWNCV